MFDRMKTQLAMWLSVMAALAVGTVGSQAFAADKQGTRDSSQAVKKEAGEAVEAARRHVAVVRKDFEQQMDEKLEQARKRAEKWRLAAEKTGKKWSEGSRETLKSIEEKQVTAEKRLKALKGATQEAWKSLSEGVEGAIEELEKGLDTAESPTSPPTKR